MTEKRPAFHWFHNWTKWTLCPEVDTTLRAKYGIREDPRQERSCTGCGYRQEKRVDAY